MFKMNTRQECSSWTLQNSEDLALGSMAYPYEDVGARLIHLRKALGISAAELCRQAGISPSLWSQFEQGKRRIPLDDAITLRTKFGATLDWLYIGDESGLSIRVAKALLSVEPVYAATTIRKPN